MVAWMDSMWGTSDRPLLTLGHVRAWEARRQEIVDAMRALQEEDAKLARKLEAAQVFMIDLPPDNVVGDVAPVGHQSVDDEDGDARERGLFPDEVLHAVSMIGGAPPPKTIRSWLRQNGTTPFVRDRADKQYFYTTLMRHAENGRLIKVGEGYSLPASSPQGETEGVAPSVPA
jgi:hypothetical protein